MLLLLFLLMLLLFLLLLRSIPHNGIKVLKTVAKHGKENFKGLILSLSAASLHYLFGRFQWELLKTTNLFFAVTYVFIDYPDKENLCLYAHNF